MPSESIWTKFSNGWIRAENRLYGFGFHFLSFVPTLLVVGMALMIGLQWEKLDGFAAFAISTVSLEVCIASLRHRYEKVQFWGGNPNRFSNPLVEGQLTAALLERKRCWAVVISVIVLWGLVSASELGHLCDMPIPENSESLAVLFSGVAFGLALMKIWFGVASELHAENLRKDSRMKTYSIDSPQDDREFADSRR